MPFDNTPQSIPPHINDLTLDRFDVWLRNSPFICGQSNNYAKCPIRNWICWEFGTTKVEATDETLEIDGERFRYPPWMAAFITEIDRKRYFTRVTKWKAKRIVERLRDLGKVQPSLSNRHQLELVSIS